MATRSGKSTRQSAGQAAGVQSAARAVAAARDPSSGSGGYADRHDSMDRVVGSSREQSGELLGPVPHAATRVATPKHRHHGALEAPGSEGATHGMGVGVEGRAPAHATSDGTEAQSVALSSNGQGSAGQLRSFLPAVDHTPSKPHTEEPAGIDDDEPPIWPVDDLAEYLEDYNAVVSMLHRADCNSFAYRRLQLLEARYGLHRQLNRRREELEAQATPHRDMYNTRRVDTHVHHSACMTQKHLLRFIKSKLRRCPDDIVHKDKAKGEQTLA